MNDQRHLNPVTPNPPRQPSPLARTVGVILMLCLATISVAVTVAIVRWLI